MRQFAVAILLGLVLGVGCSRFVLTGSWLALVPWAIGGIALGIWCVRLRQTLIVGAVYGFVLAYSFMVSGYTGSTPLWDWLIPFLAFGAIGAVCGIGLGLSGNVARRLVAKLRTSHNTQEAP